MGLPGLATPKFGQTCRKSKRPSAAALGATLSCGDGPDIPMATEGSLQRCDLSRGQADMKRDWVCPLAKQTDCKMHSRGLEQEDGGNDHKSEQIRGWRLGKEKSPFGRGTREKQRSWSEPEEQQ